MSLHSGIVRVQVWVTLGNAGTNLLLLGMLRVPLEWSTAGAAGAAILTATQLSRQSALR